MGLTGSRPRFYADHRLVTGAAYSTGYVMDRHTGKAVRRCRHHHRSWRAAQDCAERMTRKFLRNAPRGGEAA